MTTPNRLEFKPAKAAKRICFESKYIAKGDRVYIAPWEDVFVIAINSEDFFIATNAQTMEFVVALDANEAQQASGEELPQILPTNSKFHWTVQCGISCLDYCDETIKETKVFATRPEADEYVAFLHDGKLDNKRYFIRIRGPGFYSIKRPNKLKVVKVQKKTSRSENFPQIVPIDGYDIVGRMRLEAEPIPAVPMNTGNNPALWSRELAAEARAEAEAVRAEAETARAEAEAETARIHVARPRRSARVDAARLEETGEVRMLDTTTYYNDGFWDANMTQARSRRTR